MPSTKPAVTVDAPLRKLQQLRQLQTQVAQLNASRPTRWRSLARPDQLEPEGDHNIWLIMTGRGWGKTATITGWAVDRALAEPGAHIAAIAPVWRDLRHVLFEGQSGFLRALDPEHIASYNASDVVLTLRNGSKVIGVSGDRPDRLRGRNLHYAVIDELAFIPRIHELWSAALMPALRMGPRPRVVAATTPRPIPLLRELQARDDGSVAITRGSTWANAANLSAAALAELRARYEGTKLGRAELEGELVEDVDGALWTRDLIEATRVLTAPHLVRVVVGVDPAVSAGEHADHTGIVVAGRARDGQIYILADDSMRGSPRACMSRAVTSYQTHRADRIVGEVNNGGDYIEGVLRTVDENVSYKSVRATRGKYVRAEPIAAAFEQGRAHIVGVMTELEDELCSFVPDSGDSPDRLDAMVWSGTELNTGASALSYLSQISTVCGGCGLPNPSAAARCRSCGAELAAAQPA